MKIPSTSLSIRATPIYSDDKSNAITIATWVTLVILVLVFIAREGIKFTVVRKFAVDDVFILIAMIFAIGLSITSLLLASDGLGVFGVLTLKRANDLMKELYASNFLYISSLGFAKLSLVTFFYSIHFQPAQRRFVLGFGVFILAWTIASIITVAFQCGFPRPWEIFTLHCYNSGVFWIVYTIIDMTTDVSIIMLSVNLVAYLKVKFARKLAVVACFAPRILVIGAALARLIYLYPITPHDKPEIDYWVPTICTQMQVCLSVVTACIPYMRPLFDASDSGVWRGEQVRSRRATFEGGSYENRSSAYLRGHKQGQGHSFDSTGMNSSSVARTPDVSPRIPSPPPMSPLTPPRVLTPPNTSASSSRNPSERGLRLHIPPPGIQIRKTSEVISPQTASSHALSPECLSPQALLLPPTFSPNRREPSPPPRSHSPRPTAPGTYHGSPDPYSQGVAPRFSLFPQTRQQPRYSLIPQQHAHPAPSIPTTISERSSGRTPVHHMTPDRTPETRTPSPNPPHPNPSSSHQQYPPRTTSFATIAYDDPLRTQTRAKALTTAAAVPAPIPAAHDPHTSIPSYYVKTPPTAHTSDISSPQTAQTVPSYYMNSPPLPQPPAFPVPVAPNPYSYEPTLPAIPTSPQRQRNQRILTPQNSSRRDQMSPVSPVTPQTPMNFWREEEGTMSSTDTRRFHAVWEEQNMQAAMPVVRDVRSSPKIVVQSFS